MSEEEEERATTSVTVGVFSEEAIDKLTEGFLKSLQPEVLRVEQSLNELTSNQEEMLSSLTSKRTEFENTNQTQDINNLLQNVPVYKQKLIAIQKNMSTLDKRMKKLQIRANKLKELRLAREAQSKKELEKRIREENMLEAKPSK